MTNRSRTAVRRALVWTLSVLALALGAHEIVAFASRDDEDPGRYSAFTREQLTANWPDTEGFPLVVPVSLPQGAADADEVGFNLNNVVTDSDVSSVKRDWVSYYDADVLGGTGSSFRVYQRHDDQANAQPCGPSGDVPYVERRHQNAMITVCSTALGPDSAARTYWESVVLTEDLMDVSWLRH